MKICRESCLMKFQILYKINVHFVPQKLMTQDERTNKTNAQVLLIFAESEGGSEKQLH